MRLTRAPLLAVTTGLLAGPVRAESTAALCPSYAEDLVRAREALARGDRTSAVTALHEAQAALAECMRDEAENGDQPIFLVAAAGRRVA